MSPANIPPDIPYAYARLHGALLSADDKGPKILLRDGADPSVLIELRLHIGEPFTVERVETGAFDTLLAQRYAMDSNAAMVGTIGAVGAVGVDSLDILASDLPTAEDLLGSADDAPAIRLINGIIADAARQGVSDVHIEPYESALVVRMRIDGVLSEVLRMPPHVAPVLVSRIKVMARLDIAERRLPQDGRISLTLGGRMIDARVSTLPARGGERVVLRLLDSENAGISFDELGLTGDADAVLRAALAQPNGIILVTGPTGSGKTTTLYAAMKTLNDGSRNILTVEDPVEYAVDGVGQTQVNPKVGLTFAAGLRAILRQDPDVVLVGEIRDRETADIAVQASLTGHLVLSTVHTNDAIGAITRLRDMKIEPFLIASSLRAVIAQRLVRRLCPECRVAAPAEPGVAQTLALPLGTPIARAAGCSACGNSGYRGRIGVFEAIRIDDRLRAMINDGADEVAIEAHGFAHAPTLAASVRALVIAGETTAEEALRISRQEEIETEAAHG
ncbi:MAG: ATPase, T2SS/T4P/T4SS family [Sphingopyxis sp.]